MRSQRKVSLNLEDHMSVGDIAIWNRRKTRIISKACDLMTTEHCQMELTIAEAIQIVCMMENYD